MSWIDDCFYRILLYLVFMDVKSLILKIILYVFLCLDLFISIIFKLDSLMLLIIDRINFPLYLKISRFSLLGCSNYK